MKNLHKKIGAMVLAGMVVLGGVAAGGVNSFAASSKKVAVSNKIQEEQQIRKVEFACKLLDGKVIEHKKSKKEIDSIGSKSRVYKIQDDKLHLNLYDLKNRNKKKEVKVRFKDLYYLIQFN